MTSCSRLPSKQGMLKALYEIPQVLHLSVYEMQKVLCLDMSLISKYPSMYMYVLQSLQYSDHVYVHITKSRVFRTCGHVTKSAVLRTCICTHYEVCRQNMSGAQPSKEYSTCPRPTKYNKETNSHWSDGHSVHVKH